MKVEPHATFRFVFRGTSSKSESLNKLRIFLHDKEWLPDDLDYDTELLNYHTEGNGICEVTLKKIVDTSIEDLVDMFFSDLCKTEDVKWVKVLSNENTDKLIQNHFGRYQNRQTVELSTLKENDEVVILFRE